MQVTDAAIIDTGAKTRGLSPSGLPFRDSYIPAAKRHEAMWLAFVTFASVVNRILQHTPVDDICLRYKGETIRAIKCNLQHSSEMTTDETIAASQILASIDVGYQLKVLIL
jgi:hypothetical protein